jgi:hypothetical protein
VFSLKELIHCVNTVEVDGMVECNCCIQPGVACEVHSKKRSREKSPKKQFSFSM